MLDRAHNGRINQEQFRQFLMRYNVFVPHDQLMGLLKRYDDFGDGTMNLAQVGDIEFAAFAASRVSSGEPGV